MVRRLHNWSYRDVTDFLKGNGFEFGENLYGSHQSWIKYDESGEPDRIVEIAFRHNSYPVGTMKDMVRQSGIHEDVWIQWTRN